VFFDDGPVALADPEQKVFFAAGVGPGLGIHAHAVGAEVGNDLIQLGDVGNIDVVADKAALEFLVVQDHRNRPGDSGTNDGSNGPRGRKKNGQDDPREGSRHEQREPTEQVGSNGPKAAEVALIHGMTSASAVVPNSVVGGRQIPVAAAVEDEWFAGVFGRVHGHDVAQRKLMVTGVDDLVEGEANERGGVSKAGRAAVELPVEAFEPLFGISHAGTGYAVLVSGQDVHPERFALAKLLPGVGAGGAEEAGKWRVETDRDEATNHHGNGGVVDHCGHDGDTGWYLAHHGAKAYWIDRFAHPAEASGTDWCGWCSTDHPG